MPFFLILAAAGSGFLTAQMTKQAFLKYKKYSKKKQRK